MNKIIDFEKLGLTIKPEVTDKNFSMIDTGAVELETGELFYGFVRRLKPLRCLSTGVYTGISDLFIAQALKDNNLGHLWAIEFEPYHLNRATELWRRADVLERITPVLSDSMKFEPIGLYEMMHLDTELDKRLHETIKFYPYLADQGYIFIHDMPSNQCRGNINPDHPDIPNWPVNTIPEEFDLLIKEKKLLPFYFPSARGLMCLYKPSKGDFI